MADRSLKSRTVDRRLRREHKFLATRLPTAPLRDLPDFLIIGEMKCGTSSLFHYLQQHPKIESPYRKEVHFFDMGFQRGLNWYRAHFPLRTRYLPGMLTGEATPDYLFTPGALERIRDLLPDVRLIILLRDPVERAISHYFHEVRMGREHLPILEAFRAEDERIISALHNGSNNARETYVHASYRRRGLYARSLERCFVLFPQDQIHILSSAELFTDPGHAVEETLTFLGLKMPPDPWKFPVKNMGKNRESVPPGVYEYLEDFFTPHMQPLRDMLNGRPLPWLDITPSASTRTAFRRDKT